jgi:hypothetical protein
MSSMKIFCYIYARIFLNKKEKYIRKDIKCIKCCDQNYASVLFIFLCSFIFMFTFIAINDNLIEDICFLYLIRRKKYLLNLNEIIANKIFLINYKYILQ